MLGVFAGVMIMGILRNGLNLMDVSSFWQQVLIGSIIVLAVLFLNLLERIEKVLFAGNDRGYVS